MTLKRIIIIPIIVVVCIVLGAGAIIGVQKLTGKNVMTYFVAKSVDGPLISIGDYTVNLLGNSFLKTSITIEGVDAKSEKVLKEKEPFLKDKVNSVLANRSLADVQTLEAREKLRQELMARLNELTDNKIKNVLFQSFMYQ